MPESVCIHDPLYLFLFLCGLNVIAWLLPVVTQSDPFFRRVLVSLNMAAFVTIYVNIRAGTTVTITYPLLLLVLCMLYVLYHHLSSIFLLGTVSVFAGINMFDLRGFVSSWLMHSVGWELQGITLDIFILTVSLVTSLLYWKFASLWIVGAVIDAFILSILMVLAGNYTLFLLRNDFSSKACCDDMHVHCPLWFRLEHIVILLFLFFARIAFSLPNREKQTKTVKSKTEASEAVPLLPHPEHVSEK